jgi:hypothetical protein
MNKLPICETMYSTKEWRIDGILHREDGPAVEYPNGTTIWHYNGRRHRDDGPAVEYSYGTSIWYNHGSRHRIGGPAVELFDGTVEWWLDDKIYTEEEYWNELFKRGLITEKELFLRLI